MYGLRGRELEKSVDEVLDFIDLRDRQKDKVDTFSGGMKRRVNIGVGLLHKPQLVYMDEPTVGVDPQSRRRILDTVLRLRDEQKMTVLYTTHLMEEAQELSDRVGIIDHGEIIAMGTVGELIQKVGEEDRLIFKVGDQAVSEVLVAAFKNQVEGVTRVAYDAPVKSENGEGKSRDGQITIYAKRGRRALPEVIGVANHAGLEILSVEVREPDLEAVFLQLTGRELRD
jgi:ABC-2 type transport system ATP-binding protein